jgi:2C-methyl-D-erythritol 2,4-cyclodiphosphate synthase
MSLDIIEKRLNMIAQYLRYMLGSYEEDDKCDVFDKAKEDIKIARDKLKESTPILREIRFRCLNIDSAVCYLADNLRSKWNEILITESEQLKRDIQEIVDPSGIVVREKC